MLIYALFHVIPEQAVPDADRYRGTEADEVRLFYVAVTRAQKYLALCYSPGESQMHRARSPFFDFATRNPYLLTAEVPPQAPRSEPKARHETPEVTLSFSDLKYFFECPYQFKLRFMYGFNAPIHEALGYGKSVHDVMAEIHKRAIDGDIATDKEAGKLKSLPPGRTLVWPLGQGFNILVGDGPQVHTFKIEAEGPFGEVPSRAYPLHLSDWRGVMHRPAGSLHQVATAIEKLAGETDRQE